MNIQIFGKKKCQDTRKAQRFFTDRGMKPHVVDLDSKGISPGELEKAARSIGADNLIDTQGKTYKKRGMSYMEFDPIEEILEDPTLLKTPLVREGSRFTNGYQPEVWKSWIQESN
jgi:arsenate reductase